jgi:hypothetical protein
VLRALANIEGPIAAALEGAEAADQAEVDRPLCELDGSRDKSRLGANALLAVMILEAIERAGYKPGTQVALALDCAASEFYRDDRYRLDGEDRSLSRAEFCSYLAQLVGLYPIVSIEDGMAEDAAVAAKQGKRVTVLEAARRLMARAVASRVRSLCQPAAIRSLRNFKAGKDAGKLPLAICRRGTSRCPRVAWAPGAATGVR